MFSLSTKISMARAILTKKSPFYIQFYISNACHLRCKMCNIVQANSNLPMMNPDHIETMAKNLKKIGAGVVLLTGGEPLLNNNIPQIVKSFKQQGLDVRMQTSGLITKKELLEKSVVNGARDINVSLDSLDEGLSDYINGIKGSWSMALKTISYISNTFPSKDSICALGCVLSKYNVDEIEAVLDFATEIGWWLSLVPVHLTTENKPLNFRGYDRNFAFEASDFPKLRALLDRLKKKKRTGYLLFDSDDYLDSIYQFVTTGQPNWRHKGVCDTPFLYFAILPDGRFAPCCDHRISSVVYVYDADFPEKYKSLALQNEVRGIARNCPGCNFGSFPEMTLSARSLSTILERVKLQLKAGKRSIVPFSESQLYTVIEKIKAKYDIYNTHRITTDQ